MVKFNTAEAARYLGCSKSSLEKRRTQGSGIPYIKVGRSVFYTQAALDVYLASRTFTATSQYGGK